MPPQIPSGLVIAFIVAFIPAWILFFFAVMRFAGKRGGWFQLAELYPLDLSDGDPDSDKDGERFRFRSLRMRGGVNYGNMVEFVVSDRGLVLRMPKLIRFGHRPMLLPWEDMTITATTTWGINAVMIEIAKAPELTMRIRQRLAIKIKEAAGDHWPSDVV